MRRRKQQCWHVIVRNARGGVVLDWWRPLIAGRLTVRTEGSNYVIERKGLINKQVYIPSMNESVQIRF